MTTDQNKQPLKTAFPLQKKIFHSLFFFLKLGLIAYNLHIAQLPLKITEMAYSISMELVY
jgi:hypothetical protein